MPAARYGLDPTVLNDAPTTLDDLVLAVGKTEALTPEQKAAAARVVRRHVPAWDAARVLGMLELT